MTLTALELRPEYTKGHDDIAADFYLPCMERSDRYDRVSGYFSSSIFALAWPALRGFVARDGSIRLICSPNMSAADVAALQRAANAELDHALARSMLADLRGMLASSELRDPTVVLAALVARGTLQIRVAIPGDGMPAGERRIFHDKVGLFFDDVGNVVGFRGSMNETFLGLSPDGNLESVDVFPSWCTGRDAERVATATVRFERLWNDDVEGVTVRPLPHDVEELLRVVDHEEDSDAALNRIIDSTQSLPVVTISGRTLRHHQSQVLENWRRHGRRGLAVLATGAGKTAIGVEAISDSARAGLNALVTVPSALLLSQWAEELAQWLPDARVLRCGDGDRAWARPDFLRRWLVDGGGANRVAIATLQTASTDAFVSSLGDGPPILLVADEAHRLGSPTYRRLLRVDAAERLGLSATPERYGDDVGTGAVLDYFTPVLEPRYGLQEAIRDGVLTPYAYHPHVVSLTTDEQDAWDAYSTRIARRVAAASDGVADEAARRLLIERSRIAKRAAAKIDLASAVLEGDVAPGDRWLVYCDDRTQLDAVRQAAQRVGVRTTEYHSAMAGDRAATLEDLAASPGVLVSIRCLDEGVDLPAVTHALILASSRNPREFIQRRGRILRRHPQKSRAHLHDAIVVPAANAARPDRLMLAELGRAIEFARGAINPEAIIDLQIICAQFGVDLASLESIGEENDTNAD